MALDPVLRAIIDIGILIVVAKIFSGILAHFKLPEVLGELFAGIVMGPFALGALQIAGIPLIELNEHVLAFAEIGAILLLFVAGLQVGFGQFRALGVQSFVVGASGVFFPFILGLYITLLVPFPPTDVPGALIVASALTATSIAITVRTLEELGKMNSAEGQLTINAAVIDDVLGLIVLSIVISFIQIGAPPHPLDIAGLLVRTLGFWFILLIAVAYAGPKLIALAGAWKAGGTIEAASTALCFGSAVAATIIGLHPIVGAFSAGMALAGSRVLTQIRDYIDKINLIFSPIFFAVIGARLNIWALSPEIFYASLILIVVAIFSKFVGCGVPATILMRNSKSGLRVGVGMISRGEVGLIIAGLGLVTGVINEGVYAQIITMAIVTTILAPLLLKRSFGP